MTIRIKLPRWEKTIYRDLETKEGWLLYYQRRNGKIDFVRTQGAWIGAGWRREYDKSHVWLGGMRKLPWLRSFGLAWHRKADRGLSSAIKVDKTYPRNSSVDVRWRRLSARLPLPMALYEWAKRREEKRAMEEMARFEEAYEANLRAQYGDEAYEASLRACDEDTQGIECDAARRTGP